MSLLNQVLQDLEKRDADNSKLIQDPILLKQIKVAGQGSKKNHRLIIIVILLFIVSVAYGIYLFLPNNSQPSLAEIKATAFIKEPASVKIITPAIIKNETPVKLAPIVKKQPKKVSIQNPVIKQDEKSASKKIKPRISTQHKAEYFYDKAKESSDLLEQQFLLNKALSLKTAYLNAHLLLATNLLRQGLTDSAITSLQNSLKLFPENIDLTNILAQLYLQTKQFKFSLNTLLKINPANTRNETYLSLLAAAYQQNNDAENSAVIYQKLLHINTDKAEYWLGLALAFEKLKRPKLAKTAYQHALNKNSLQANIVSYIKQRIAQLN